MTRYHDLHSIDHSGRYTLEEFITYKEDKVEKLIMIGAGGYAKSVLDSLDYLNYKMIGFIDQFSKEKEHLGYPVLAEELDQVEDKNSYCYFISIGDNIRRKFWFEKLKILGLKTINVVDRSAIVSKDSIVGTGCFIGKMAIINSKAVIGDNCIINTKALVEHGCRVCSHANISTNSVINGDVIVGEGTFVGSCSVTAGQLKIGTWSIIGAGAVVIEAVSDSVTVAGVPAKIIKENVMYI